MNLRPAEFIDETAAWRARVAAEVAARYGALVSPDVVARVPAGASGLPALVWDATSRELVYDTAVNPMRAAINTAWKRSRGPVKTGLSPEVATRRAELRTAHAQGKTDLQIAEALNVSISVIRRDRVAMKLRMHPSENAAQARVARVLDMLQRGFPIAQIAAAENLTQDTVERTARERLGLYVSRRGGRRALLPTSMAERRAAREVEVTRMAGQGLSARKIAVILQLDRQTVLRDIARLALPLTPDDPRPKSTLAVEMRRAPRRASVAELHQQGHSINHIARALQISHTTVKADLSALLAAGAQEQVAA